MNENIDLYKNLTKFIEETSNKQSEDIKTYIKAEIEEIKERINKEVAERKILEEELKEFKNKYKILEKELRKNNIIIFNLGYQEGDDLVEFTVQKLNRILEINIKRELIDNIYTIGKKKEDRPIIVKFTSYLTKQNVLKNCKKLKGTNVSISEELTLEERKKQKILRQHLKKARAKKLNAYIKGYRLYVNEEVYEAEELIENEEDSDKETYINEKAHNIPPQTSSYTLPTENKKQLNQESKEADETEANKTKKRKITPVPTNSQLSRSSPRLTPKEVKTNKNSVPVIPSSK